MSKDDCILCSAIEEERKGDGGGGGVPGDGTGVVPVPTPGTGTKVPSNRRHQLGDIKEKGVAKYKKDVKKVHPSVLDTVKPNYLQSRRKKRKSVAFTLLRLAKQLLEED